MLLTWGRSSLSVCVEALGAGAPGPAVVIAKGERSVGAIMVQGLRREGDPKPWVLLSFSFGVLGHLAKVALAQLSVACWVGDSHHNVDEERWH